MITNSRAYSGNISGDGFYCLLMLCKESAMHQALRTYRKRDRLPFNEYLASNSRVIRCYRNRGKRGVDRNLGDMYFRKNLLI